MNFALQNNLHFLLILINFERHLKLNAKKKNVPMCISTVFN